MGESASAILAYLRGKSEQEIYQTLDCLELVAKRRQTELSDLLQLADLLDFKKISEELEVE